MSLKLPHNSTLLASYDFLAPARIAFGWGRWQEAGPLAALLGRRAWLVVGSRSLEAAGLIDELKGVLQTHGVEPLPLAHSRGEPTVADVDAAVQTIRTQGVRDGDLVLAIGGGSAIDLAKAIAALAVNTAGASVRDYLEGVGSGLKLVRKPLPIIAIPTTAGTGSEATKNAVISVTSPDVKKSLRSDDLVPRAVIIDPQLAVSLPATTTAHTGMDAITQLIESYISRRARPIPQALAGQGLALALPAIVEAVEDGSSRPAREAMAHAALLSGMALANSGLGLAHGVAAALGVHCDVPHGLACAVMLPTALRVNRHVAEQRVAELAVATGLAGGASQAAAAEALIERIVEISRRIGIPCTLTELGVRRDQIPALVRDSRGNSMDGNPKSLDDAELTEILEALL
jgi:alcohol dehydrogenase class IV